MVRDADDIEIDIEELEPVIMPGIGINHNETVVSDRETDELDIDVEELEPVIATAINHNETLIRDEAK